MSDYESSYERGERLKEYLKDKDVCCSDFKSNVGGLLGMDNEKQLTLELAGDLGEWEVNINNCPWCGNRFIGR